jgi:hypothetical protein
MTDPIGSIIMAAGRGSRMKGFQGSKTLLPLAPMNSPFQGNQPILLHILGSLPAGPKALIVSHEKESIMEATRYLDLAYLEQPVLNGTGGALLAARPFLESAPCQNFIITMEMYPLFGRKPTSNSFMRSPPMCLSFSAFGPGTKGSTARWPYASKGSKESWNGNTGICGPRKNRRFWIFSIQGSMPPVVRPFSNPFPVWPPDLIRS